LRSSAKVKQKREKIEIKQIAKKAVFFMIIPPPSILCIVKSYPPSPLKGEGFPYLSVFFRVVFHNFFDITLF
jgi:hypothetical protein